MKRYLILSALLSLFLVQMAAQDTPNDSVKTKIRDIKLSEKYLYAETASMTSLEEARNEALEELHIRVVEVLAEQGKEKAEMEAIWEKVGQQYAGLDYRNGPLTKVFLYIPKRALTGEAAEEEETATVEQPVVAEQPAVAEQSVIAEQPVVAEQPVIAEQPAVPEQPATEPGQPAGTEQQPETAETQPTSTEPASTTLIDPNLPDENSFALTEEEEEEEEEEEKEEEKAEEQQPAGLEEQQPVEAATETPTPQATPVTEASEEAPQNEPAAAPEAAPLVNPLDTVSETHRRVLTDLLKQDTYEGVMLYLSSMKEDGRLMYGRISTLVAPEQAYFIIIKDGQLLTILNRGEGERINLRSLQPEMLKQYKGHAIIWLKIFN